MATSNLAIQLPMIATEFPEIADCHLGTINLLLDTPLLVLTPDHRTRPIPWSPEFDPGEIFDFLRIVLEAPVNAAPVPAWLYIAHWSPHRADLRVHEVLAPKMPVRYGDRCRIGIKRDVKQMPYGTYPIILVT